MTNTINFLCYTLKTDNTNYKLNSLSGKMSGHQVEFRSFGIWGISDPYRSALDRCLRDNINDKQTKFPSNWRMEHIKLTASRRVLPTKRPTH